MWHQSVKKLDDETTVFLWENGSMSVSNTEAGIINLTVEQTNKFIDICKEVLAENGNEVDVSPTLHE